MNGLLLIFSEAALRWRTGCRSFLCYSSRSGLSARFFIRLFALDRCANGQKLKSLSIIDEWTREGIAHRRRAVASFNHLRILDNGPEFIARALRIWALFNHSDTATIDPGKPWQNGSVESFHATFRRECLNTEEFAHLREAQILIEQWRWEYITQRPHSSLGYRTPAEFGTEARVAMKSEVHPITPEPLS